MRAWVLLAALGAGCSPGGGDLPHAPMPASHDEPGTVVAELEPKPTQAENARAPAEQAPDAAEDARSPSVAMAEGDEQDAPPSTEPDPLTMPASRSTSIGPPTSGRLEGGVALPLRAPGLLFNPSKDPGSRFGTVELVQGLVRAAAAVERAQPGAPVTVGDLAREGGGDIPGHASHRTGRDVDVLFYLRREGEEDEDGEPFVPAKAIPLDPEGRGTDYGDLADPADDVPVRIDVERTWAFVAALLADEHAEVQRILIVEHLRERLLEEARRAETAPAVVQRFAEITCQPRFPHDDHMHIRVFCSAEDLGAGCQDTPPLFPWRKQELAAAGVKPVLAKAGGNDERPATPKKKPTLKTLAQARAEAGPMHEDVVEFLDRRESWAKRPRPGRRWCR